MMLTADIGNSRIKWALVSGGALECSRALEYRDDTLHETLDAAWSGLGAPGAVVYCSVGASATGEVLERWTESHWGIRATRVRTEAQGFGVRCAYAAPETLGADRWAALVACRHKIGRAAVIVDCGTAITVDALSDDGTHLGGVIVPGVSLMRHALTTRTDQIPSRHSRSSDVFAKSTADGVAAGTLYAAAAAVDRLVSEMQARLPENNARILTGGAMNLLKPLMITTFEMHPDLVLYGLAVIGGGVQ